MWTSSPSRELIAWLPFAWTHVFVFSGYASVGEIQGKYVFIPHSKQVPCRLQQVTSTKVFCQNKDNVVFLRFYTGTLSRSSTLLILCVAILYDILCYSYTYLRPSHVDCNESSWSTQDQKHQDAYIASNKNVSISPKGHLLGIPVISVGISASLGN